MSNKATTPGHRPPFSQQRSVGMTIGLLGLGSLWAYACSVFIHGGLFGRSVGRIATWALFFVGFAAIRRMFRVLLRRGPTTTSNVTCLSLSCFVLAGTLLLADLAFAFYSNWSAARSEAIMDIRERREDKNLWHGEIFPEHYFPTERAFSLYKPNINIRAETYGEFYHPDLLKSDLVAKSVLERKILTYRIGPPGLRDTTPLSKARIFALGDSFAMGFGTVEDKTWTT